MKISKQSFFRIVCLLAFALFPCACLRAESGFTLTGRVLATAKAPIANARVFIFSAAPRFGPQILCPTCYADCGKHSQTDADGCFRIESLNPSLLFRVITIAKDSKTVSVSNVDPSKGSLIIPMEPLDLAALGSKRYLEGRVFRPDGKAVMGAIIRFLDFYGEEANCGGLCDGVDHLSISDETGHFVLAAEKKFDWMSVEVEGPGLARKKFFKLPSGRVHRLRLSEGVRVAGRLISKEKPLGNARLGIRSADTTDRGAGWFDATTDAQGQFVFEHLPPFQDYFLFGFLESLSPYGALAPVPVAVRGDGTQLDLGELKLISGHRLAGQVLLSDRGRVPPGSRLLFGHDKAWDSFLMELPPDGRFEISGIPPGPVSLGLRIGGYHFSEKNPSLDPAYRNGLVGILEGDSQIQILMEPGEPIFIAPNKADLAKLAKSWETPLQGLLNESL